MEERKNYQKLNRLNLLLLLAVTSSVESESLATGSSELSLDTTLILSAWSTTQSAKSGDETKSDMACLVQ